MKYPNESGEIASVLASMRAESGLTLLALTEASPVLLVFLRHFGCSFCRQALSQVASLRPDLEERGVRPVFVHLGTPERAKAYFEYYGLADVERISDPEAAIYQHPLFDLSRTHPLLHFFKARVWAGWLKGALFMYGIGTIQEDAHQMPGLFYLKGAEIIRRYRYRTIADEPDYLKLIS
ncbi:MAG TPA: SelL-related redox protein [Acidobacteriaceae bacterium]